MASKYALTECGRLWHWRYSDVREIKASSEGYFSIKVKGIRWLVWRQTLQDRLFPDRPLAKTDEIDWDKYDPNEPIAGAESDPLRDKGCIKFDGVIVPRCLSTDKGGPTVEELDRAHRLFYGE